MAKILDVHNISVSFSTFYAVQGISFDLNEGEAIGIVGESGAGKSAAVQSITRILPSPPAFLEGGHIFYGSLDLLQASPRDLQRIRGREIGMIFQNSTTFLNPTMKIGEQIAEGALYHRLFNRKEAKSRVIELLRLVGIPDPEIRFSQFPHQLSGGMRQKVMIAIALAAQPRLLIADEPTTGLDTPVQMQILALLKRLQQQFQMSLILISHDIGVVAELCSRILVMQSGKIVESGPTQDILNHPAHPYTCKLLGALPRFIPKPIFEAPKQIPLIQIDCLTKSFTVRRKKFTAVRDISFSIAPGETLGLIGESGCGKSTLARLLMRLYEPDKGRILFQGQDIARLPEKKLKNVRRCIQMIFQNPLASLNPRMTIEAIISEPLIVHSLYSAEERKKQIFELLDLVRLSRSATKRFPHEFSGGQQQRIAIARALALQPQLIICDEPTSSLDTSTQAQIIDLLLTLQKERGLAYLFISHDLAVVKTLSTRIAVMYLGEFVETGDVETIYANPRHPYTRILLGL